jgi:hypothetical protein
MTWYRIVAVAALAACNTPTDPDVGTRPSMVTDRLEYELALADAGLVTTIGYAYENRTHAAIEVVNCRGDVTPHLEKLVDGDWVIAWSAPKLDCLSPPVVVASGERYADEIRFFAAHPGTNTRPRMLVPSVTGTYRLVWGGASWPNDEPLPRELIVSNAFGLVAP